MPECCAVLVVRYKMAVNCDVWRKCSAHDEQGVNPGQIRGFDGVLYKL